MARAPRADQRSFWTVRALRLVPYWILTAAAFIAAVVVSTTGWPGFLEALAAQEDGPISDAHWWKLPASSQVGPILWVLWTILSILWIGAGLTGRTRTCSARGKVTGNKTFVAVSGWRLRRSAFFCLTIGILLVAMCAIASIWVPFRWSRSPAFTGQVAAVVFLLILFIFCAVVGASWWNWILSLCLGATVAFYANFVGIFTAFYGGRGPSAFNKVFVTFVYSLPALWLVAGITLAAIAVRVFVALRELTKVFSELVLKDVDRAARASAAAQDEHEKRVATVKSPFTSSKQLMEIVSAPSPAPGSVECDRFMEVLRAAAVNPNLPESMRGSVLGRITSLESEGRAKQRTDERRNWVRVAAGSGWAVCPKCGSRSQHEAIDPHFHKWYFCNGCGQILDYSESYHASVGGSCSECGGTSAFKVTDASGWTRRDYVFCSDCGGQR